MPEESRDCGCGRNNNCLSNLFGGCGCGDSFVGLSLSLLPRREVFD